MGWRERIADWGRKASLSSQLIQMYVSLPEASTVVVAATPRSKRNNNIVKEKGLMGILVLYSPL